MAISAQMVKELREMTGAGMLDSKKALEATNGDMEQAVEFLRKKGLAGAEKKAGRITAEGVVMTEISDDKKTAVVVEVNSETDFVSKNEKFRDYVSNVTKQALVSDSKDMESFLSEKWSLDNTKTVKEELSSQISIIGENLTIRRKEKINITNGFIESYIHDKGRIGVLVAVESNVVNDELIKMAHNVAMQVASMRPKFLDDSEISDEFKNKEKEILLEEAKNQNPDKPENIIKGMVEGRFNKHLKEICLMNQVFIMAEDGKQLV